MNDVKYLLFIISFRIVVFVMFIILETKQLMQEVCQYKGE